jgi:glycosyltransferase involved in cell wall biosynthesis
VRLAYVTTYDSTDVHNWSGLGYYIAEALTGAGCAIERVGVPGPPTWLRALSLAHRKVLRRRLLTDRETFTARRAASKARIAVSRIRPDVVFCPGTGPLALLDSDVPQAFWIDAVFPAMLDYYPEFTRVAARSIRQGMVLEALAIRRAKVAVFASDWAARGAREAFGIDEARAHVVPFGSNFDSGLTPGDVDPLVDARLESPCRLLFIGVDWERKGGRIALEAARAMNAMGLRTELHVVGCVPPVPVPDWTTVHGFISKRTPEGSQRLRALLSASTFFLLPTRAECAGIVFSEASSFALPCLASDTGGVSTYVRGGENGRLLPMDADPVEYARIMVDLVASPTAYRKLAAGAHRLHESTLNWKVSGSRVRELLQALVS